MMTEITDSPEQATEQVEFRRLCSVAKHAIELLYGDAWDEHNHNKIRSTETPEWYNGESQESHQVCPWPDIDYVIETVVDALEKDESRLRAQEIEDASTQLLIAVWRQIVRGAIPDRGPVDDMALILRDALNPDHPGNPEWLPEPLATERAEGYPGL